MPDEEPEARRVGTFPEEEWIASLAAELRLAEQDFLKKDQSVIEKQKAVFSTLAAVSRHLGQLPGLENCRKLIGVAAIAISEMSDGHNHPLLEKQISKNGGTRLRHDARYLQAVSVSSIELLISSGVAESAAVDFVAEQARGAGIKGFRQKREITSQAVRTWRTNANSGSNPELRNQSDNLTKGWLGVFEAEGLLCPPSQHRAKAHVIEAFADEWTRVFAALNDSRQTGG